LELLMGLVWSGIFLVQLSGILRHAQSGGSYSLSPLAFAGIAATIFVCGAFAGRLLLRREMRWSKERRDTRRHA
jgi:hypothetical protein